MFVGACLLAAAVAGEAGLGGDGDHRALLLFDPSLASGLAAVTGDTAGSAFAQGVAVASASFDFPAADFSAAGRNHAPFWRACHAHTYPFGANTG